MNKLQTFAIFCLQCTNTFPMNWTSCKFYVLQTVGLIRQLKRQQQQQQQKNRQLISYHTSFFDSKNLVAQQLSVYAKCMNTLTLCIFLNWIAFLLQRKWIDEWSGKKKLLSLCSPCKLSITTKKHIGIYSNQQINK